ncbi:CDP-diacylglycerol--glycerol-3-phosphate 3-phosphatidyltransferase [Alginatibacterium sediminis]|uniref:CDP-diacylglycerol--glycerol-3-phosphate 3-phosphatidyltransferase n=1 Tax=Alginatibacterium sediminis TaxID=2164068 RepID=A0A420EGB6_9ALTE|nr:CDP-diacylglycerol--glycerol-3-phosphate 3-phosphatidyltransferase [Alginatibacterium sediminis]RKF19710.1 CDP-diacylglycerol--glycerol-3-phosphate 3-phosphatidyltransferase [Alginatibacterium sediminis]
MNNIPNILTMFRVVLIPVFLVCFYLPTENAGFWSALVFTFAAFTDYLDGYLARRLGQSTPFGAFLDPVADKLMVAAALVVIAEYFQSPWVTVPAIVMISREIVISALREWMAELGKRGNVAVSSLGKYKTTFQMIAITALLWNGYQWMTVIGTVLLFIAMVLTLWSMVVYLRAAWPTLRQ